MRTYSFQDRIAFCTNPTAKKLLQIMEDKKSNLAVSADFTTSRELLACAKAVGPQICVLKTHIDILEDFTPEVTQELSRLAKQHHFLLFEDRKFADIGNTVLHQYGGGIYKIADWADITNAHIFPGPGIISGLKKVGNPKKRALLLLAEMSSEGALNCAEQATQMAEEHSDFVIGFIAQRKLLKDPKFLYLTPGVHLHTSKDGLGQQYRTPEQAMASGTDIIIVGRAICTAGDPLHQASLYRHAAWNAYVSSLTT